jgi:PKD repeat protein
VNATVDGCADGQNKSAKVTLVATTSPPAASGTYTWDFGDGSPQETTTAPTDQHSYGSPGSYTVTVVLTPSQQGCPSSTVSITVTVPQCTTNGGGACCGSVVALIAAALVALGVALFIGLLSLSVCLHVAVPPFLWYIAGGLVAAGLLIILICYILCVLPFLNCQCPTACDWLLIAWYALLVGDLVALYLAGCCGPIWWVLIGIFTALWIATFLLWLRRCKPNLCTIYLDLIGAVTLGGVSILAYFALIPALKACGSSLVGIVVALVLLVLAALAGTNCTQKT